MSFQDDFRTWSFNLLSNPLIQQIAPLLILSLIPVLVFYITNQANRNSLFYSIVMVLESLGLGLPWNWLNGHSTSTVASHEKKKSKKTHVRTRAEQSALNGSAKHGMSVSRQFSLYLYTTIRCRIQGGLYE